MTPLRHLIDRPHPAAGRVGMGTAHGTFGELLQGALPGPGEARGEGRFLVTLPMARWSSAWFELRPPGAGLTVHPAVSTKAAALAEALLIELGHSADGSLFLHSSIPMGKGLASSSADMAATARAVMAALVRRIPLSRLGAMMAAIEPTDGVIHPGIVAFDHRRGEHLRTLGRLPALQVVAVDQGGVVDTVMFNSRAPGYDAGERRHYQRLLDELGRAVESADVAEVGRISTLSAALNQSRMPNRNFAALSDISRSIGGLGLVACHSGTMIGILLDPRWNDYRSRLSHAVHQANTLPGHTHLFRTLTG